jgi:Spy/CpxP family protein refolding chaperone
MMTRALVIICFLVAFAAGLVLGLQKRPDEPLEGPRRGGPPGHHGWLAAELNLSEAQQAELKTIWSETAFGRFRDRDERRRQLTRQRDEAIESLIPAEKREEYRRVLQQYDQNLEAMEHEGRKAFETAVERTRQILTPEQREKYDRMLERHRRDRGPGRHRGGPPDRERPAATSRDA